jgi:hypothetical protein
MNLLRKDPASFQCVQTGIDGIVLPEKIPEESGTWTAAGNGGC